MQRRQSARVRAWSILYQKHADLIFQGEWIPAGGQWPVAPQDDVPVSETRIWVDGCFDFAHHGLPACRPSHD